MASLRSQSLSGREWELARAQHGVVALFQLIELGYTMSAIKHRIARGRLHPVRSAVYAVGRPELTRGGEWMAAVLTCGAAAVLSHTTAAALWEIRRELERCIHVTVPLHSDRRQAGIRVHRRTALGADDVTRCASIPVTTPVRTLLDLAAVVATPDLEAAVNEADRRDLVDPEGLRSELDSRTG